MQFQSEIIGNVASLKLAGEFTFRDHQAFSQAVNKLLAGEWTSLMVDFAGVEYIDSSALGMLLLLRHRVNAKNRNVSLCNCTGTVKHVLDIANLHKLFTIS